MAVAVEVEEVVEVEEEAVVEVELEQAEAQAEQAEQADLEEALVMLSIDTYWINIYKYVMIYRYSK